MAVRMSHREDDVIFPVLEDFLLAEATSLSMLELALVSDGFLRSSKPFRRHGETICFYILNRVHELLPTHGWCAEANEIFKLLTINNHVNPSQMRALQPTLES